MRTKRAAPTTDKRAVPAFHAIEPSGTPQELAEIESEVRGGTLVVRNELAVRLSGPGNVRLEGQAEHIHAELSGSGALRARRLAVRQADIEVRGPRGATVNHVRDGEVALAERGRRQVQRARGRVDEARELNRYVGWVLEPTVWRMHPASQEKASGCAYARKTRGYKVPPYTLNQRCG